MTRLLYSNLLKFGFTNVQSDETRVIDSNERMAQRIEEWAEKSRKASAVAGAISGEEGADGFSEGLSAETLEGVLSDRDGEDGFRGNVIKADVEIDRESLLAEAQRAADDILVRAREEADGILAQAETEAEQVKMDAAVQGKERGYQDGLRKAERDFEAKEQALEERRQALEQEYEDLVDELEPKFADAITAVYEQLFHVELSSYREILLHLIGSAIRKIEGGRDFLVHVSAEDYPYVSMEKRQLTEALTSPNATLELVEDITLKHNECMIETEGGIFDCGLGTQLEELTRKIRLLSYEHRQAE
ncbi:MAG: FliH/SctL family protein [Clostridium sp.]|nr:FliH/SctL family protein [Acetatifactor muris]MCM1526018.1 FliH/SctL family protein [Bacteroides sp.]MCM1562222.1 FliH/SctL family protein [Clostridium sp.]